MSDADFEVVREAWAAARRRDNEAFAELLAEDIEIVPFGAAMLGERYQGREGVLGWMAAELRDSWDYFETYPEDFSRVGDRLLVTGYWRARAKGSGVELERPATWVIEVRDGKIAYWQTYTDREEALRDIGTKAP